MKLSNIVRRILIASLPVVLVACQAEKVTEQQGWIGGQFESIPKHGAWSIFENWQRGGDRVPEGMPGDQSRGALVTEVYRDTPTFLAGLNPGDIILRVDSEVVESADDLYELVESSAPGARRKLAVCRFGELLEKEIVVGRESFDRSGRLTIGLALTSRFDWFPDPSFNLLGLLAFHWGEGRAEARSARNLVRIANRGGDLDEEYRIATPDDWSFTLLLVSVARNRTILAQETVEASDG